MADPREAGNGTRERYKGNFMSVNIEIFKNLKLDKNFLRQFFPEV